MLDRCVGCEDDHSSYVLKQWSDLSIVIDIILIIANFQRLPLIFEKQKGFVQFRLIHK